MGENKLKSAIIGCGQIAGGYDEHAEDDQVRTHAKAYQQQSATELVAVVDENYRRAKEFSAHWGVPKAYADAAKMLSAVEPDIVSICTPDNTHAEMLELCLECPSIKAVWCEKPLMVDVEKAGIIVSGYTQRGVVLAVNYWLRWDAEIEHIKSTLQKGDMGNIQKVVVYYTKGICHNGSYAVDLLLDWFGLPREMQVFESQMDFTADDPTVDARLLVGDVPVYFIGVDARKYSIFEIDILGTLGRINVKVSGRETKWFRCQPDQVYKGYQVLRPSPQSDSSPKLDMSLAITRALQEIVHAIQNGTTVRSNGKTALATLKVCCELAGQAKTLYK
ncbi:MAG: Gfo/Idh/MocA family oxidoreductase [Desulfobacteraceae bacterium]|nr:Gfo/Idh/MocA family oxidoreductase [Desulfobacteraceae bacterium]